jgi:hypothetical protein
MRTSLKGVQNLSTTSAQPPELAAYGWSGGSPGHAGVIDEIDSRRWSARNTVTTICSRQGNSTRKKEKPGTRPGFSVLLTA